MIVDTSVLLAFFDEGDDRHASVRPIFDSTDEPYVISPYVVAELDYLVASRLGVRTELMVLRELNSESWELAAFGHQDLSAAIAVIEKYADQSVGLTDASMVVLADKFATRVIATLDRRHFGLMRPLRGGRFRLLP